MSGPISAQKKTYVLAADAGREYWCAGADATGGSPACRGTHNRL
jgi:hypothetical protein